MQANNCRKAIDTYCKVGMVVSTDRAGQVAHRKEDRMTPFWKVYHFPEYMRRRTVAVFFDYGAAVDFVHAHGREYAANGCYIGAFYPERKAA
jgi:hypothetical protein